MNMQETKSISPYKQELKVRILTVAMKAFAERGIRAVKMDDVASELGISKRTLYEIYENKELLLYEGVTHYYQLKEDELKCKTADCRNVMEILLTVYRTKVEEFRQTNQLFYDDLVKYPKVQHFLLQQNQAMRHKSMKFLERGIAEGYFRKDLNCELAARMFDALGKYVVMDNLYQEYSIEEIFVNLVFVSMRGLCTEKGIKALDKII